MGIRSSVVSFVLGGASARAACSGSGSERASGARPLLLLLLTLFASHGEDADELTPGLALIAAVAAVRVGGRRPRFAASPALVALQLCSE